MATEYEILLSLSGQYGRPVILALYFPRKVALIFNGAG